MKTSSTVSNLMTWDHPRLGVLRYSRAYTLTVEALYTMCCEPGSMRERLQKVDLEFFSLYAEDFPEQEGVRASYERLRSLVISLEPRREGEGRIASSLAQRAHAQLAEVAQLLWETHRDFSLYMQTDT
jgi:hypothetical protein